MIHLSEAVEFTKNEMKKIEKVEFPTLAGCLHYMGTAELSIADIDMFDAALEVLSHVNKVRLKATSDKYPEWPVPMRSRTGDNDAHISKIERTWENMKKALEDLKNLEMKKPSGLSESEELVWENHCQAHSFFMESLLIRCPLDRAPIWHKRVPPTAKWSYGYLYHICHFANQQGSQSPAEDLPDVRELLQPWKIGNPVPLFKLIEISYYDSYFAAETAKVMGTPEFQSNDDYGQYYVVLLYMMCSRKSVKEHIWKKLNHSEAAHRRVEKNIEWLTKFFDGVHRKDYDIQKMIISMIKNQTYYTFKAKGEEKVELVDVADDEPVARVQKRPVPGSSKNQVIIEIDEEEEKEDKEARPKPPPVVYDIDDQEVDDHQDHDAHTGSLPSVTRGF